MIAETTSKPVVIVIHGIAGDLAWRKLVPALFSLFRSDALPQRFAIVGLDSKPLSNEDLLGQLHDGVQRFSAAGSIPDEAWPSFASHLQSVRGDLTDAASYGELAHRLSEMEQSWGSPADQIFYLAVPPALIEPIVARLHGAGLANQRPNNRVVVEKPFGHDLTSARNLNRALTQAFGEGQIFRIDH